MRFGWKSPCSFWHPLRRLWWMILLPNNIKNNTFPDLVTKRLHLLDLTPYSLYAGAGRGRTFVSVCTFSHCQTFRQAQRSLARNLDVYIYIYIDIYIYIYIASSCPMWGAIGSLGVYISILHQVLIMPRVRCTRFSKVIKTNGFVILFLTSACSNWFRLHLLSCR
jgi:hypothetical protein